MNLFKSIFDFFYSDKKTSPTVNNENKSNKRRNSHRNEENPSKRLKMSNSNSIDSNDSQEENFNEIIFKPKTKSIPQIEEKEVKYEEKKDEKYDDDDDEDVSILYTLKRDSYDDSWSQRNTNASDTLNITENSNQKIFDASFYDKFLLNGKSEIEDEQNEEDIKFNTQFEEEEEDELVDEEDYQEEEEWDDEEIQILTSIRNLFSPKINWSLLHWEQKRYQRYIFFSLFFASFCSFLFYKVKVKY